MKKLYLFFYVFFILFIANCSSHVAKKKVDKNIVQKEMEDARKLFQKYKWPSIDVTRKSVEETAASVLKIHDIFNQK